MKFEQTYPDIHSYARDNVYMVEVLECIASESTYGCVSSGCQFRTVFVSSKKHPSIRKCSRFRKEGRFCWEHNQLQIVFHELYKLFEVHQLNIDGVFLRIFHCLVFFSSGMDSGHSYYTKKSIKYDLRKSDFIHLVQRRMKIKSSDFELMKEDISSFILTSFLCRKSFEKGTFMKVSYQKEIILRNTEEEFLSKFKMITKKYYVKLPLLVRLFNGKSALPIPTLFKYCNVLKRSYAFSGKLTLSKLYIQLQVN